MQRSGATLLELLVTLTLLGILYGLALPRARRGLDALRVRSARESAFGVAMRVRALAQARGGATLVIDVPAHTISAIDSQGIAAESVHLAAFGVDILADGAADRVRLRYDGRGIGRMASRTIRFRKGSVEAGLTFSSFGRVRRW